MIVMLEEDTMIFFCPTHFRYESLLRKLIMKTLSDSTVHCGISAGEKTDSVQSPGKSFYSIKNRQKIGKKMYYADFPQSSFISFVFETYIYNTN